VALHRGAHDGGANNELAFLVTGMYGKPALRQMGAPLRLAVPWKYGFKSIKSSCASASRTSSRKTFWEGLQAAEYGFWQRQSGSAASALESGDRGRHHDAGSPPR